MLEAGLEIEEGQIAITLPAIIDSGFDETLMPISYLDQMGAPPSGDQWLSSVTIGRDILNQFIVTFNGLASVVELSQ